MTDSDNASPLVELAAQARREVETLDKELAEIDLLVGQAKSEAARHEAKRTQVAEKLTALAANLTSDPKEVADLNGQLLTLTKRATVMEAQVDVLAGKHKVLGRYRDALARYADELSVMAGSGVSALARPSAELAAMSDAGAAGATGAGLTPAVSRLVLGAQEDLRREIARAMHDGPAQSLTNIVLQAQIVDRLLARDPEAARGELSQLISMVQSTLDATKSFIFDVRPMVLDDLGLVPTVRRAARDRGRRAQIPVEFESMGTDRRLSMEVESGLFRIVDEALAGYLAGRPDRVTIRLDWSDRLGAVVAAIVDQPPPEPEALAQKSSKFKFKIAKAPVEEMPAALAAMIEDRRLEGIRPPVALSPAAWRDIQERATTIGVSAELAADGSELRLIGDLPTVDPTPADLTSAD